MTLTKYDQAKLSESQIRNDSFLQRLFLLPQYAIVMRGRKGTLSEEELKMPANQATEACSEKFQRAWDEEIAKAKEEGAERGPSLMRAIVKSFVRNIYS
jgi:hypothetical protein